MLALFLSFSCAVDKFMRTANAVIDLHQRGIAAARRGMCRQPGAVSAETGVAACDAPKSREIAGIQRTERLKNA
jgi:hypothetical protein